MDVLNMTAFKVRVSDLSSGKLVQEENTSYLLSKDNRKLARFRIMATVIDKFISKDNAYAIVTLDDSTETIRVKAFKGDVKKLSILEPGDLIDVVGNAREYEGELYINPEIITKIENPNWELLRKLELAEAKEQGENLEPIVMEKLSELGGGDGATLKDLIEGTGAEEKSIIEVMRNLMMRGDVYEPKKGRFKLV
jgi:RPA family protein